jgi:uncharacterized CHY-type Zn-finger protein
MNSVVKYMHEAHVKTDHSQTIFDCNNCHKTLNSQAFQEEHTERNHTSRITNICTFVIRLNHIMNNLAPACTMCGKIIVNKAAKGSIDAKFLVNASTQKIS